MGLSFDKQENRPERGGEDIKGKCIKCISDNFGRESRGLIGEGKVSKIQKNNQSSSPVR